MINGIENHEKIERGKRIKHIREIELNLNKTEFGKKIGVSGQFVGLVENGKGNLVYPSLKKLMDLSGHSSDYILYGLDDTLITRTKELLNNYSENQVKESLNLLKNICNSINNLDIK